MATKQQALDQAQRDASRTGVPQILYQSRNGQWGYDVYNAPLQRTRHKRTELVYPELSATIDTRRQKASVTIDYIQGAVARLHDLYKHHGIIDLHSLAQVHNGVSELHCLLSADPALRHLLR